MKNILVRTSVAIAVMAGLLSAVVAEAPPAYATTVEVQPTKIAVVIEENAKASISSGCSSTHGSTSSHYNTPYICDTLLANANGTGLPNIAYTGTTTYAYMPGAEYMSASPGYQNSAPNYAAMVAGDDCAGTATDGYFNGGSAPLKAGSPDNCGSNLFELLDNGGVNWTEYAEDFSNNGTAVTCTDGFSDPAASTHIEFVRRHNSALFYDNITTDCTNGGNSNHVLDWPGYNGGFSDTQSDHRPICVDGNADGACDNNAGMRDSNGNWPFYQTTLPPFSVIVPNQCHDEHNSTADCTAGGNDSQGVFDGSTEGGTNAGLNIKDCDNTAIWDATKSCSAAAKDKRFAMDFTLSKIVPNLQNDVGPTGVVLIVWDEGNANAGEARSDSGNIVSSIILPGTGATLYHAGAAPTNNTDQAGLLASIITAMHTNYEPSGSAITCSALDPGNVEVGDTACADAAAGNAFADGISYGGSSNNGLLPITLADSAAPASLSVTPSHGNVGSNVVISGTDTAYATSVSFNGVSASFHLDADGTSLDATVPTGASTGAITVTNGVGSGNAGTFTVDSPFLVQKDGTIDTGNSTSPSGSLPSSATSGNLVVAVLSWTGSGTITARPTGFNQAVAASSNQALEIDYCTTCTGTSFSGWTLSSGNRWNVEMLEYANVSVLDKTASAGSGAGTSTTLDTGTTATTTVDNEVVVGGFYNNTTEHAGSLTPGYTEEAWANGGTSFSSGIIDRIATSQTTFNATETLSVAAKTRGVIATFKPSVSTPTLVQKDSAADTANSTSPSGSLTNAVGTGHVMVAVITWAGSPTITGRPTGFSQANATTLANMEIDVCTTCAGQTSTGSWTLSAANRWSVETLEYANIAGTVDTSNTYTSGSSLVTTVDAGSISTANANDVIVVGFYNGSTEHAGSLTAGFTEQAWGTFGGSYAQGVVDQVVSSTGTYQATETLSTSAKVRGAIVAFS